MQALGLYTYRERTRVVYMYMYIYRERWSADAGIVFLAAQFFQAHTHVHVHMCMCVYVYMCVYLWMCACMYMNRYKFSCILICMYKCKFTYTYCHTICQENMYRFVSQNTVLCACGACASMCVFIYTCIDTHPNIFPKPTTTPRYKHVHTDTQTTMHRYPSGFGNMFGWVSMHVYINTHIDAHAPHAHKTVFCETNRYIFS